MNCRDKSDSKLSAYSCTRFTLLCAIKKVTAVPGKNILQIIPIVLFIIIFTDIKAQRAVEDTLLFLSHFAGSENVNNIKVNDSEQNKESNTPNLNFFTKPTFSGDWWNVRNTLSNNGLDFDFVYKGEVFSNVSGGYKKGTTSLDNIDLIFSADLEKSLGFTSSNITVQFLGNSGGTPCDLVGAAQGLSNIETVPTWKLYQILFEQKFFSEQFSVLVGLYDFNSEFDTRETSSIFINPSHGIGPDISQSGLNGPSIFPTTSAAVRIKYESENGNYFQTAVLDGVPGDPENPYGTHVIINISDGLLLTAELGFVKNNDELLDSKIAVGAWTYTTNFDKNNYLNDEVISTSLEKNYGFYISAEKVLVSSSENQDKNLIGFLRIGYANKNINPVDFYLGAGLKFKGLFDGLDDDELGLALALAHNSLLFRKNSAPLDETEIKAYELNIEATYSLHVTPWLTLQPDIQYIINPSYCAVSESALVMGSRIQFVF